MKEYNTKINNLCTIIIPTYNRTKHLKRILSYYNGFEENFNIIIADSSSTENKKINKKSILLFPNLKILYLNNYHSNINPYYKTADALNYANTKYSVFCADDDFVIPNGINKSVDFLEKNPYFSCAHGEYIFFYLKTNKEGKQQIYWNPGYSGKSTSLEISVCRLRLAEHLSNYTLPTIYAVHKTALLKMIFKETVKYTDDGKFGELLPSMLDLVYGKMKKLDILYSAKK